MTDADDAKRALLVVEDDPGLQRQLKWHFSNHQVVTAGDRSSALAQLQAVQPAVVTLDLGLPPDADGAGEGLATLQAILAAAPWTKVIVLTGNTDRANAVKAIALGAYDFCNKPAEPALLSLIVERAFRLFDLEADNVRLRQQTARSPLAGIVASSQVMLELCRMVEKVAPTKATVLLLGESGTGKELFARALHNLSPRSKKPFVAINCGAIPDNLLESELFGFERGAFTGAVKQTPGRLESANGGTLFLDEIGDMPKQIQVKLLRFLQERSIERIGGRTLIPLDVRVISATHRNLKEMIDLDEFREDLYYRICELTMSIPPLRERNDDVVVLAQTFLQRASSEQRKPIRGFGKDALDLITRHSWPGNVRELENRINRAVIMAEDRMVTARDLDLQPSVVPALSLRAARRNAEIQAVERALQMTGGNLARTAKLLEISRPTLYDLLKEYQIVRPAGGDS